MIPREGTEAHYVEKEVEKKKKLAKNRGLDTLFSNVYHDCIGGYSSWINSPQNKRYVLDRVTSAKSYSNKEGSFLEFVFGSAKYKIVSQSRHAWVGDDQYNDLDLFMNEKKVFGISESVTNSEWATYYTPLNITAYVDEEWVEDFKSLREHRKKVDEEVRIENAENPEKIARLKKEFGITAVPTNADKTLSDKSETSQSKPDKKQMSRRVKIIIGVIVIAFILAALSS